MRALVVAVIVSGAGTAHADEASDLFERGRTQKEAGDLAAACKSFEKSYELERAAGTALNLAECEERAGNWEYALELYEGAALVFAQSDRAESAVFARKRAAKLREAHAPKPLETPDEPKRVSTAKPKTWVLGVGIGATAVSVLGVIGVVYSYSEINAFERSDLSGEFIGQPTVTEKDCGKVQFMSAETNDKFAAACSADQRLQWLIPTTFVSGVVGVTAIAYYLWTRPKKKATSMAVIPTASGGVVATFEW